jgi:hypothetical protein
MVTVTEVVVRAAVMAIMMSRTERRGQMRQLTDCIVHRGCVCCGKGMNERGG